MDEMDTFKTHGWEFLCSGEQLPSGLFQGAVRRRVPPDGQIRTLVFGREHHGTAREALEHAKALARQWAGAQHGKGAGDA